MNRRLAVLALLMAWAAVLSVESWLRPPADPMPGGLPDQLAWRGRTYRRVDGAPRAPSAPRRLPLSMVRRAVADYRPVALPQAAPPSPATLLRLELLVSTRSGWSGAIPVDEIPLFRPGRGNAGRCVILDASARVRQELSTSEQWQRFHGSGPAAGLNPLTWLAGLHPYRINACLWLEAPEPARQRLSRAVPVAGAPPGA